MQELFEEYRKNRKLLERQRRKLADMDEVTDTVSGSSAEWPHTQHTVTVTGRNAPEETELIKEIAALEKKCRAVEDAVKKAPNASIRLMLELKYIDGLKWDDVALEMGEDVSGDAIRKRAEAFWASGTFPSGFSVFS